MTDLVMVTTISPFADVQFLDHCPVCRAELEPYTATVKEVVAESRFYPAEFVVWLHESCPECGAEGEQ